MSYDSLDTRLAGLLEQRKSKATYRSLKEYRTVQSANGRAGPSTEQLVDFSSNDYLSLTHSQSLRRRYLRRLEDCPDSLFGSTGSRLLDGTTPYHTALEDRLASFFRYDFPIDQAGPSTSDTSALLFNSGYDANVSFFSTVPQRGDYIVHDELVHASVWDGMRGNTRRGVPESHRYSFRHNSVDALEQILRKIISLEDERPESGMIYIGLESLYSMDGDLAPLEQILAMLNSMRQRSPRIINPKKVILILDEAHTTGISGRGGRGLAWHLQDCAEGSPSSKEKNVTAKRVREWCQVRVMTFGKAVGGQGAVLVASPTIRQFLINYARPFIFSTAMSVNNVIAIESAWDVLESREGDQRRRDLQRICSVFNRRVHQLLHEEGISASLLSLLAENEVESQTVPTHITPLITPHPHSLASHLRTRGYLTRPVVHPTVPRGKERVRVCLHADNREEDVLGLVAAIRDWLGHHKHPATTPIPKAKL